MAMLKQNSTASSKIQEHQAIDRYRDMEVQGIKMEMVQDCWKNRSVTDGRREQVPSVVWVGG